MAKKILIGLIIFNIVLIIAGIVFTFITYNKIVVKPNLFQKTTIKAEPTIDPLAPYSILLMGYGGGIHEGGKLTDSMIVAKIDPHSESITLISIPRDLWVPIPIIQDQEKNFKINTAYSIGGDDKRYPNKNIEFTGKAGGGQLSKYVVGKVLGFNIDYFVALDFQGFVKTVNILGGVDIPIQRTFNDPFYPIEEKSNDTCDKTPEEITSLEATMSGDKLDQSFTCRYEYLHFNKGLQHMDGATVLKYVRSRHSVEEGGDFNRAARQRIVLTSVKDKVMSINFLPKIIPFIQTLSNNLTTDIDLNKMQDLINKSGELSKYTISSIALTDQNVLKQGISFDKQSILMPKAGENNWDEVHSFIASPSATITTPNQ